MSYEPENVSDADFIPFVTSSIANKSEDVSKINSVIKESNSKGLALVWNVLQHYDEQVIIDHAPTWLKLSSSIAIRNYASDEALVKELASKVFKRLIELSSKLSESSREVANHVISGVIDRILTFKNRELPVLRCLNAIVECYPRASDFKLKRGKICKFLVPAMLSVSKEAQEIAIQSWSQLPRLGSGGGHDNKVFAENWKFQMSETLTALQFIVDLIFNPETEENDSKYGSVTLPLPKLSPEDPRTSYEAVQRFLTLCKCISSLLNLSLDTEIEVPFQQILDVCANIMENAEKIKIGTSEILKRRDWRWEMERNALTILKDLLSSCSQPKYGYTSQINNLLQRVVHHYDNHQRDSYKLRSLYYETISTWVQVHGVLTSFICYESEDLPLLLVMTDEFANIAPFSTTLTSGAMTSIVKNQQRNNKKRKTVVHDDVTKRDSLNCFYDESSHRQLAANALVAVRHIVYTFGKNMSSIMMKSLQTSVVDLVRRVLINGKNTELYRKCAKLRKHMYELLFALTIQPNGLSIDVTNGYFKNASIHDSSVEVRSYCREINCTTSALSNVRVKTVHIVDEEEADAEVEDVIDEEDEGISVACQTDKVDIANHHELVENIQDVHVDIDIEINAVEDVLMKDDCGEVTVEAEKVVEQLSVPDEAEILNGNPVEVEDNQVSIGELHKEESVDEPATKRRKCQEVTADEEKEEKQEEESSTKESVDNEVVDEIVQMFYDANR